MKRELLFTVTAEYDGKTVGDFLRRFVGASGSLIKQMKKHSGAILQNGSPVFTNHLVHANDKLSVSVGFDDERSDNIIPIRRELNIIYEDEDILCINKPANMPIHPSFNHHGDSLAEAAAGYFSQKGQSFVFRCVNRLDKGTSGLTVAAKHAFAQETLKNRLHSDGFIREYAAIVCGRTDPEGVIDAPIARCPDSVIKHRVSDGGRYAVTEYKTIKYFSGFSLVRLRLKTGRTHQIRVHMSYIGHPLLGDFLYGSESGLISRPALHSSYISLIHPVTKERMCFFAPLPDDMAKLI